MEPAIDMKMRVIGATVITDGIEMPLDKADKSVLGTDSEAVSTKEPTTKVANR
ncbi:hypothetical protein BDA96_07G106800 [Sorghum bicolor]|uniref:Uncharacterized protein n=1 Tax=Sorghum bicolor TaxID=4558 RepID=A0A921U9C3_SORBI|nr:hypothetical protein BDA96_07G106800 [Sorghum bicolor]